MLNLSVLKDNFNEIKTQRRNILELIKNLEDKINKLKSIYKDLLNNNKDLNNSTLDTLYFQTKLITVELENTQYIFKLIDNRIYGDYYKLYKTIVKYINTNNYNKKIKTTKENNKYPEYNDLKLDITYDFDTTIDIYDNIIKILEGLLDQLCIKKDNYENEKFKLKTGINIDTLLHKLNHSNIIFEQDISLFNQYLLVYNNSHKKYLNRFMIKTKLFYGQVNSDIKFEQTNNTISDIENLSKDNKDNNDNIFLNNKEEEAIRNMINTTTDELNNMIYGVISPQNSEHSNDYNDSLEIDKICKNNSLHENNDEQSDEDIYFDTDTYESNNDIYESNNQYLLNKVFISNKNNEYEILQNNLFNNIKNNYCVII